MFAKTCSLHEEIQNDLKACKTAGFMDWLCRIRGDWFFQNGLFGDSIIATIVRLWNGWHCGEKGSKTMRRKDREVTDLNGIFEIVERCNTVHMGMVEDGKPYVVALNFGYERKGDTLVLYFHSAHEGHKMDILKENPNVYFQMDCVNEFITGSRENPCAYCWRYDSVMGSGEVEFIAAEAEKAHALNCIIGHLGKIDDTFEFSEESLKNTCVYRLCSTDITGKHHE